MANPAPTPTSNDPDFDDFDEVMFSAAAGLMTALLIILFYLILLPRP